MIKKQVPFIYVIGLISIVFFLPFNGAVHLFDWDEINFAEIAREMIETGEYLRPQIGYEPFWEKPPLFIWLQVISMKIFGINEFAARFPNAVIGFFTLLTLFKIGTYLKDELLGKIWVLVYLGSTLPFFYFRSGIIDPTFNLFMFLSIYFFICNKWQREASYPTIVPTKLRNFPLLSGLFAGLAVLTKGQAALVIIGLVFIVYWFTNKYKFYFSFKDLLVFIFTTILVSGSWFIVETLKNGTWFIEQFFTYQIRLASTHDAGHKGFFGYHFVVNYLGLFPLSAFAIMAFFKRDPMSEPHIKDFRLWMKVIFWVVIILFSIIQTKIVHYSSMVYFPLSFLAAEFIYSAIQNKYEIKTPTKVLLLIPMVIFGIAYLLFPILLFNIDWVIPMVKDSFTQNNLRGDFSGQFYHFVPLLLHLLVLYLFFSYFKTQLYQSIKILFLGNAVVIVSVLFAFMGVIEEITQGGAIRLYKKASSQDAYVAALGYKSYAQFYYTKALPETTFRTSHLLENEMDKEIYFVARMLQQKQLMERNDIEWVESDNGYLLFRKVSN